MWVMLYLNDEIKSLLGLYNIIALNVLCVARIRTPYVHAGVRLQDFGDPY